MLNRNKRPEIQVMLIRRYCKTTLFLLFNFFLVANTLASDFVAVKSSKAILYEGPSESTKKELIITEGYPLLVMVSLKDWLKVKDHEGKISWIKSSDITTERTVMTLKPDSYIYSNASSDSIKLGNVEESVVLKLLSVLATDGWVNVKSESQGIDGFISANDIWGI